jgi:hypothetical protein
MSYPEDPVLVAYMPDPDDFRLAQDEGWYRIPQKHSPKGLHAEYIAFYFGQRFGDLKWAIHYYARRQGHELTTRALLFPSQPDHPRADDFYYKVQLGPLIKLERPIISLRWRRVTFVHTTWDRFQDATELNDLFIEGAEYVDRLYITLKERGLHPERNYQIREEDPAYHVPLAIICQDGNIEVTADEVPQNDSELLNLVDEITETVTARGGECAP